MDMTTFAVWLTLISGALQPIQATLNGRAAVLGLGAGWAACISSFTTGTLLVVATSLVTGGIPPGNVILKYAPLALCGGALGTVILGGMTYSVTTLGTLQTFLLFFAAVAISSFVIELTGAFGAHSSGMSAQQLVGILMIIGGIVALRTG